MNPLQLNGDVSIDELKGLVGQLQSLIDKSERPKVTMTLMAFLKDVYLVSRIDMKADSEQQLELTVKLFDRWHGRPVTLSDLTPELVTGHLKHLIDLGKSAATVAGRRMNIFCLWRAAARKKLARRLEDPEEIPRPKKRTRQPQAWWLDELTQLLDQCQRLNGVMRFCPEIKRADFWVSLILFLYDTGTRIGAAVKIKPGDIDLKRLVVRLDAEHSKTGVEQYVAISAQTGLALGKIINSDRSHVWPAGKWRHELYRRMKLMLRSAGLPWDRWSMFHRMRRTNATLTVVHGSIEIAQEQLGHTSAQMTRKSYIDPRKLNPRQAVSVLPRPVLPEIVIPPPLVIKVGRPTKRPSDEEILEMFSTKTQAEIATEFGTAISTVCRWVQRARLNLGITLPMSSKRPSDELLLEMYQTKTLEKIAIEFDMTRQNAGLWIRTARKNLGITSGFRDHRYSKPR